MITDLIIDVHIQNKEFDPLITLILFLENQVLNGPFGVDWSDLILDWCLDVIRDIESRLFGRDKGKHAIPNSHQLEETTDSRMSNKTLVLIVRVLLLSVDKKLENREEAGDKVKKNRRVMDHVIQVSLMDLNQSEIISAFFRCGCAATAFMQHKNTTLRLCCKNKDGKDASWYYFFYNQFYRIY